MILKPGRVIDAHLSHLADTHQQARRLRHVERVEFGGPGIGLIAQLGHQLYPLLLAYLRQRRQGELRLLLQAVEAGVVGGLA